MNCDIGLVPLIVQWPTHAQCMSHLPRGHQIVALGMFDPEHQGVVYCAYFFTVAGDHVIWLKSFKLTVVVTWPRCNVAWLQVSVCVPVCYGLLGRTTLLCSQDWCVYLLQKIDFSHQFHVAMFSMYVNLFVAISVFFAFFFF